MATGCLRNQNEIQNGYGPELLILAESFSRQSDQKEVNRSRLGPAWLSKGKGNTTSSCSIEIWGDAFLSVWKEYKSPPLTYTE